jgi:hypothetical protein
MKNIQLFKFMKALKKRTKIEAVGMILLMVVISLSSVFGGPGDSSSDITYIWNGNGQSWVANATNLQTSLNLSGVTYFPATTIYTNKTITMPSDSSLIGWGMHSILKADVGLGNHSLIANANQINGNVNLEVKNLVLDGNNPMHSSLFQYGLFWMKVSYGIVDMVWVKDTGKDGIRILTSDHCSVSHINANNTGHHSVMFCYGTSYSSMSDLIVTDSYTESAIVEWPNSATGELNHHITMTNVVAKNDGQYGIFVRDAFAVTVTGCITELSHAEGFYVGNCYDVTLTNCVTRNNLNNAGFIIRDNADGVILSNCISRKAGGGTSMGYELQGKNIQISNCVVCDTRIPFYFNSTTSKNITISLCNIRNYRNSSVLKGDNIRILENKFNTSTATPYVLDIYATASNVQVIGNDFKYAPITSRKINDASGKAIIRDNIGFPTDTFIKSGYAVSIGKNDRYSTALELSPPARRIIAPKMRVNISGTFNSSEIITIKVEAIYYTGVTKSIEKKYTSKSDYYFCDADWLALAGISSTPDQSLVQINVYAKTNKSTSSVSVRAYFLTSG